MGLVINHNLMAMAASRNLGATYGMLAKSIARLSSGLRINSAADDAAGLAVREFMRSEIAVLNQGVRNANDAVSMLQTMDGAAQVIDEKLIRMKELAEQAATGTYSDEQRAIMHDEFSAMREEIDRIANATDFNGIKMLAGGSAASVAQILDVAETVNTRATTFKFVSAFTGYTSGESIVLSYATHAGVIGGSAMTIASRMAITSVTAWINTQSAASGLRATWLSGTGLYLTDKTTGVSEAAATLGGGAAYSFTVRTEGTDAGAGTVKIHFGTGNSSAEDYYYANKQDMTAAGLDIDTMTIASQGSAQATIAALNTAIATKDTSRAHFGAMMNRLANTVSNITIQAENIQAAESQISDVDVALEMTRFVSNQIKAQAAVAMLAQANMLPQLALTLLGGGG